MSLRLTRASGGAVMLGGALVALSVLLQFVYVWSGRFGETALKPTYVPITALELIGVALVLFGLLGLYEYQADRMGPLGYVGFVITFFGTVLLAGFTYLLTFMIPEIAKEAPGVLHDPSGTLLFGFLLTFRGLALGYLLFGITTFRAGVFSRGASALVMVAAILSAFPPDLAFAGVGISGLGLSWLGYSLWTAASPRTVERPAGMG